MGVLGVNHIAFRTSDVERLHGFYGNLLAAESLVGAHQPLRVGSVVLVFFESERGGAAEDPDEIAFGVDAAGFGEVLDRATRMGVLQRGPVEHTRWSRGFVVRDPDGRRLEFVYDDPAVYWQEEP